MAGRKRLDDNVRRAVFDALTPRQTYSEPAAALVAFNTPDLSSTGGLWRATIRNMPGGRPDVVHHLGLEALSYLLLVATLVYLDHAPNIGWDHVSYR